MSRFFEYWYSDTTTLRFKLTNESNQRRFVNVKIGCSNEEDLTGWNWANGAASDTIWLPPGDTIVYFKDIFDFDNIMFNEDYYNQYYSQSGSLLPRRYKLFTELYSEANDTIYCSDSTLFDVKKELLPVPIWPPTYGKIPYNLRSTVRFTWGGNRHTYTGPYHYALHIWKRSGLVDVDSLKHNTNEIFIDTFAGTDTFKIINCTTLFSDTNYVYYWAVRLLNGSYMGYGDNDGLGTPTPIVLGEISGLTGLGYLPVNLPAGPPVFANCGLPMPFDGFESGTFQGWGGKSQNLSLQKVNVDPNFGFIPNRTCINPSIYDPAYRDNTVYKGGGTYAANCGDLNQSNIAQSIHCTFALQGNWKKNFSFWWSAFCNPGMNHNPTKSARIIYRLYRGDVGIDAAQTKRVRELVINSESWDNSNKFNNRQSGGEIFAWRQECWDLTDVPDGTYTFEVISTTCVEGILNNGGGHHRASAWLDFCANPAANVSNMNWNRIEACRIDTGNKARSFLNVSCAPALSADPNLKVTTYYYIVSHAKKDGSKGGEIGRLPFGGVNWANGATPLSVGNFSLTYALDVFKQPVDIDSWYIVELYINTGACSEIVIPTLIKYKGIEPNLAGKDTCCPNWNCTVQLGSTPRAGYTYSWGPASLRPCLSNPNIANPTFTPSVNCVPGNSKFLQFTLYTNSAGGCSDSSKVRVYNDSLKITGLTIDSADCVTYIKATVNYPANKLNINWLVLDSAQTVWNGEKLQNDPLTIVIYPHYFKRQNGSLQQLHVKINITGLCEELDSSILVKPYMGRKFGNIDTLIIDAVDVKDTFKVLYKNRANPNSRYNAMEWRMDVEKSKHNILTGKAGATDITGFSNGSIWITRPNTGFESHDVTPIQVLFDNCTFDINFRVDPIPTIAHCIACYGNHQIVMKRTFEKHRDTNCVIKRFVPCGEDANMDADDVVDNSSADENSFVKHDWFKKVCVCQPNKLNKKGKRKYYTHGVIMNVARTGFEQHTHGKAYDVLWKN